jgi:hypothetical protein
LSYKVNDKSQSQETLREESSGTYKGPKMGMMGIFSRSREKTNVAGEGRIGRV